MGIIQLLIIGVGLLLVNLALVFFIRNPHTFVTFPGIIFLLIFFSFGFYLVYTLSALKPDIAVVSAGARQGSPKLISQGKSMTMYEDKVKRTQENLHDIKDFLNILIVQAFFALISAVVGMIVVKTERTYYISFIVIYTILIPLLAAGSYLAQSHIA
jgi:hypothetical protein